MTIKQLADTIRQIKEDLQEVERILDKISGAPIVVEVRKGDLDTEEKGPEEKGKQKSKIGSRKPIDRGRILALRRAGWRIDDIAIDTKCSKSTVRRVIAEKVAEGKDVSVESLMEQIEE